MKNTFTPLLLCISLLFASCGKKEYSCQCQGGLLGGATINIKESNERKAKKECNSYNSEDGGATDGYFNCKLK